MNEMERMRAVRATVAKYFPDVQPDESSYTIREQSRRLFTSINPSARFVAEDAAMVQVDDIDWNE